MKKAEWILRSHREHQATLKLLQAKLQRIGEVTDAERDDYIEAQMLKRSPPDGMPKTPSQNSRTEKTALTYMDGLREEHSSEAQDLQKAMQEIRFFLEVCDAMMASLTPEEVWLAREHYINGKSLGRMLLEMPDSIAIHSKATMRRRCIGVIDQLERFLTKAGMDVPHDHAQ